MPALYRQYRPQTFGEVMGQDHITKTLEQAVIKDRVSHAYLFCGPRGTGKTTTARIIAKRINCTKAKGADPCGTCPTCTATTTNQNVDLIEIDAASNRGIDDVRALRESIGLAPAMSTHKIYIIDEVHMLSRDAFSALLKTLEEPVKHAVFILATTELHKVPATIISRCQVFRFRRASDKEMRQRLNYLLKQEKREADNDVLSFIISRSDGCYRDAESLLGQILTSHDKKISLSTLVKSLGLPSPSTIDEFLAALVRGNTKQAISIADLAYQEGFDPEQFIQESIRIARDGILELTKESTSLPSFAQHEHAAQKIPAIIRALVQAVQDLAYVPQPIIALQLAILAVGSATTAKNTPRAVQPSQAITITTHSPSPRQSGGHGRFRSPRGGASQSEPKKPHAPSNPGHVHNTKPSKQPPAASLDDITSTWSDVIQKVRESNPVSATFLRACEPVSIEGSTVTLRVHFPLHRNFFEREDNKHLVEQALSNLIHTKIHIRCRLEENTEMLSQLKQAKQKQEEELIKNVKEVFGS